MTGEIWGVQSYQATGWAAVMVSIIVAIELARSTLLMHRVKSIPESPDTDEKQRQPVGTPENTATTPPEVATEAIEVDAYILDDDILDDDVFVEE